ncbi:response regulator transcription factor [Limosilactobacillus fastidiosus]|uniref:Response regulator transcription factor n=1 Tax=Limosilactobacillus fastidiosus TaxID=2759855 RepID=A0A7W3YBX3_9LACO|nr:response regulator transcription factor [Limosilactobacillus fastidiosus]MBB1062459.1 response regulator transcription factor [Limosilactobacillus fastidiosus]MBB1085590.1 response regulator transcription factor [Limosilactobacillus fastidiosus]MCD7083533.1 response regulator transcription factor [Limosilactobacillus fastidiosus]MCD7086043.1 response regulator transcription factor [Limosilactobacillus fastidiosus]MCD7114313.1 response regulator transcription factor [Limosilactobacillus fast
MRILLAEDEGQLAKVIKMAMNQAGYQVDTTNNGQQAVNLSAENAYDVIILDIMMPGKNGIEALKEIRSRGDKTYIMMLTAMAEEDDRVNGLDSGADDYLTKPFSLKELLARLRSLERRTMEYNDNDLKFVDLHLDSNEQVLESNNSISLSREETQMLEYFILNSGKKLESEDIIGHVWSAGTDEADPEEVWINICYLRQKLQSIQSKVKIIGEKGGPYALEG